MFLILIIRMSEVLPWPIRSTSTSYRPLSLSPRPAALPRRPDEVFRTQSAVSMQMRRLEERIGRPLFEKDGRSNRLTAEGERLLNYARRMLRLNHETLAAFDDHSLKVRFALACPTTTPTGSCPKSWADLPSRTRASRCRSSVSQPLIWRNRSGAGRSTSHVGDASAMTSHRRWCAASRCCGSVRPATPFMKKPVVPLAVGRPTCAWRKAATEALDHVRPRLPRAVYLLVGDCRDRCRHVGSCRLGAGRMRATPWHARARRS
jgi:hypothetical protein